MQEALRVLLVEDSEEDALFTLRALNRSFQVTHERVETPEGMNAALKRGSWDIVISDYNMPRFSGTDAFLLLKNSEYRLPFILVSGAIGEETAVEAMRTGVDDYILKGNLARLVPAVRRELQRAKIAKERKHIEEERDLFFTSSLDMQCIAGMDGFFKRLNPVFEKILGFNNEELMSRPFIDFIHPDDAVATGEVIANLRKTITTSAFENRFLCKDGSFKWLCWNAILVGESIYAMSRDVTEQRQITDSLRSSVQMQEAVVELGRIALQGASLSLVFARAVELSADLFGTGHCAVLNLLPDGRTLQVQASIGWKSVPRPTQISTDENSHAGYTIHKKKPVLFEDLSLETRFKPSEGMTGAGIVSGMSVIIGADDKTFGVLVLHFKEKKKFSHQEVSFLQAIANVVATAMERSRFEAQLNTSDRMATVGQMAAGVAHEVNNPLSYISANLEMLAAEIDFPSLGLASSKRDALSTMVTQARDGIERVRVVVKDLTTFSRSSEQQLEPIEMKSAIDSSIRMTISQIRHRAKLVVNLGPAPLISANESQLGQVILNLLINATQAIAEGSIDKNEIKVSLGTNPKGFAFVEIADTGAGISPEVLPSIFDPFFTTKPVGVGTGLGLSICRNIVLKMNGELTVESRVGIGTTFRLVFPPAIDQSRKAIVPELRKVLGPTGKDRRLKILLLDDEKLLVMAVGTGLSKTHDVVTTTSPLEALSMIAGEKRDFDVIFCDLMMEEMTGMDFYEELRRLVPGYESRIIFMTGGTFTERARLFLESVPNLKLLKPFNLKDICSLLQTDSVAMHRSHTTVIQ